MILLKGGRIIDPASATDRVGDVLIVGDRIQEIADSIDARQVAAVCGEEPEIYDCSGCIVGPGLVDVHVHFRDPGFTYKEDIYSGAKVAAAGGFTSVILMANTKPAVDNADTLKYVLDKGKETDINVYTCANVTKGLAGKELTDFHELKSKGAIGFTDDGIPILDEDVCRSAMEEAAKEDVLLSFHEEDPKYISNNGVNHGKASEYYGIGGSDRQAEISMVERDIRLAIETGARINIQHISAKETVELIRQAKKTYPYIYGEATPHHIALTEEAVIEHGTNARMNPPLRTEEDRLAIIDGLLDGTIDVIATDHAPHAPQEKAKSITEAPSGILGLETSLPIAYEELVLKKDMTFVNLFCKMSLNPAKIYKLEAGELAKNKIADVVVFDTNHPFVYDSTLSKSQNSPFFGKKFPGRVAMTICGGKIIYDNRC